MFLLSPPDKVSADFIAERKRLTQAQVDTLAAEKVPHVVLLSSIGAQHASGTGPVVSLHNAEQQLRAAGIPATFVRAAYFLENWGEVAHPLKAEGILPSFIAADRVMRFVSTPDIGRCAAQALLDGPRGVRVIELTGERDVTPNEVAATFSAILGKPVHVAEAPLEAVVPTFTSFGISENVAELYREMYAAIESGRLDPEPGEHRRGTTPIETTLRALVA